MADVLIYIKDYCPYCHRAMDLLEQLGQPFTAIDLLEQPQKRDEMITKANGRTTVPQIFINQKHVGGCDDLFTLYRSGKLEPMLKG